MIRYAAFLPLALSLAACEGPTPAPGAEIPSDTSAQVVCTMEFRTVPVTVLDMAGQPVADASFDVIRMPVDTSVVCASTPTGMCLDPTGAPEGQYLVASDALPVDDSGETFRVSLTHGSTRLDTTYRIGFDGCHVFKEAGPDTLRIGG